jgi:hypothetical protein
MKQELDPLAFLLAEQVADFDANDIDHLKTLIEGIEAEDPGCHIADPERRRYVVAQFQKRIDELENIEDFHVDRSESGTSTLVKVPVRVRPVDAADAAEAARRRALRAARAALKKDER